MSANQGFLEKGTPCWLTFTIAANVGKIVEVVSFAGTFDLGDIYNVRSKEPLVVQDLLVENSSGKAIMAGPTRPSTYELMALRKQLIPITDPNQPVEDKESLLDEIQSITVRNASVK